jgi:DNA-binding transcriptional regulator YiaG
VDDDDEAVSSDSAYGPLSANPLTGLTEVADVMLDFRFEYLRQANGILMVAAAKLEIEGHSRSGAEISTKSAANPSDEKLREELRAARKRAGHSQRQAAEKMGYDHKDISEWETGKRTPRNSTAKDIRDYIAGCPDNQIARHHQNDTNCQPIVHQSCISFPSCSS